MRRLTLFGMCLAVIGAFAALSLASAFATEPGIGVYECAKAAKEGKVYKGHYSSKKCEASGYHAEGGQKYELQEWNLAAKKGKTKAFKGKGAGANLEVEGIGGIACTSTADSGKFTSATSAGDIIATFKGCEFNNKKCSSGSKVGEIVTNPLKAGVGYLAGKGTLTPTVGVDISAEAGEVLASFTCPPTEFAVTGSVIGEVTPVNKFAKEATFVFGNGGIGIQKWKHFEEGPEDILETHLCEGCGNPLGPQQTEAKSLEETKATNKGEELELKA